MIGTWLSLIGTDLDSKEKTFTLIAYLPKATVQAAIGGVPLAMGLPAGELILTMSVLAILITAPLGAFGIDFSYRKLLTDDSGFFVHVFSDKHKKTYRFGDRHGKSIRWMIHFV